MRDCLLDSGNDVLHLSRPEFFRLALQGFNLTQNLLETLLWHCSSVGFDSQVVARVPTNSEATATSVGISRQSSACMPQVAAQTWAAHMEHQARALARPRDRGSICQPLQLTRATKLDVLASLNSELPFPRRPLCVALTRNDEDFAFELEGDAEVCHAALSDEGLTDLIVVVPR